MKMCAGENTRAGKKNIPGPTYAQFFTRRCRVEKWYLLFDYGTGF